MITKENLIKFIADNYDELAKGGCADWSLLEENDMTVKEYDDCEKAITKLLSKKHTGKANGFMSIWAVKLLKLNKEVFTTDAHLDGIMFNGRKSAENFAKGVDSILIEYIVPNGFCDYKDDAYKVQSLLEKNGYTARREIITYYANI